jgi:uncharacterized membrane protein
VPVGPGRTQGRRRSLAGAAIFGFGLGGLVDGIVLHLVLDWHSIASQRIAATGVEGLRRNVFWDGVFHLSTTVVLVVGFVLLLDGWHRQARASATGRELTGGILVGWGVFHLVDHVVFHELLSLHDIRDDVADPLGTNLAFVAIGVLLIALGWWLLRQPSSAARPTAPRPTRD